MFPLLLVLFLPLLSTEAVNVQDSFAEAGLVNDLKILAPEKQLEVTYPGLFPLAPGDSLAVSEAKKIPSIRLEEASKEQLFTVAMVDPDAPSRKNPRAAQWLHWILTNVEGERLISGQDLMGEEVTAYAGPSPPKGSGPHRYVFLVWQQQQAVSMESPRSRLLQKWSFIDFLLFANIRLYTSLKKNMSQVGCFEIEAMLSVKGQV